MRRSIHGPRHGKPHLWGALLLAAAAVSCSGSSEPVAPVTPTPARPTPEPTPEPLAWHVARLGLGSLRGVASDGSLYVSVAADGTLYSSPDAVSWEREDNPAGEAVLNGVRFVDGRFVVVGDGALLTSPDGHVWTAHGDFDDLHDVTHGNGLYLAVGSDGQVVTSPDADDWSVATSVGSSLTGVTFGSGLFVAVGGPDLMTSVDGRTWHPRTSPLGELARVTRAQGQFVAAGGDGIMTSVDGLTWRVQVADQNVTDVTSDATRLVAASQHSAWTSSDGEAWAEYPQPDFEQGVAWPPTAIAAGPAGFAGVGESGTLFTSSDGRVWTSRTSPASRSLWSVAYGGSRFCAGGDSITAWSDDGIHWTNATAPIAEPSWRAWHGIIHEGGRFLAVSLGPDPLTVATSTDCQTWEVHQQPEFELGGAGGLDDVAWGDGLYVAIGNSSVEEDHGCLIATSTDGLTWTRQELPNVEVFGLRSVAYGGGRFVVLASLGDGAGNGGTAVLVSEDGINWSASPDPIGGIWQADLVYANDLYVATVGEVWTSEDANEWTLREPWRPLLGITFGSDRFVGVGGGGRVYTSVDGLTWFPDTPVVPHLLKSAVYAPELQRFVAVGWSEIIYADH